MAASPSKSAPSRVWEETGDKATLEFETDQVVKTEADLLRISEIDQTRWRIVKMRVSSYQVTLKLKTEKGDTPKLVQMFAIRAELALILPSHYLDASEAIFKRLESVSPSGFPWTNPAKSGQIRPKAKDHLLVACFFDLHLGKLC